MNPRVISRIDRLVGIPACFVLTVLDRVRRAVRGRRKRPFRGPASILFIKMTEQGATVLANRAMQRAVEIVGRDNVYFWVFEENAAILELMDVIPSDNVVRVPSKRPWQLAAGLLQTLLRVRRMKVQATVDLEFFSRASAILAYLSGAPIRSGHCAFRGGPYRGDLLTHRVLYNPHVHVAQMYQTLVEAVEEPPDDPPLQKTSVRADMTVYAPPRYVPEPGDLAGVRAMIEQGLGHALSRPLVLLNPNASDLIPLRKWPRERFIDLGKRILADVREAVVVITGSPVEEEQGAAIAAAIGPPSRVVSLAGKTTLRDLLALYALAEVLVTNDSGPAHFASMTDVHVVVLFGPETPRLFAPLGERIHVATANLACSPCVNVFNFRESPCRDNKCMQDLTVDAVYETLRRVLDGLVVSEWGDTRDEGRVPPPDDRGSGGEARRTGADAL